MRHLSRGMNVLSNFAISLSSICILSGCVASFHLGFCSIGGAIVGIVWPLVFLFTIISSLAMGQIASAFPQHGVYHWSLALGGRGWGWLTAWLNIIGGVVSISTVNVGTYFLICGAFESVTATQVLDPEDKIKIGIVFILTLSQGIINHIGIKTVSKFAILNGLLIISIVIMVSIAFLASTSKIEYVRLFQIENFSGLRGGRVWPEINHRGYLFLVSLIFPFYALVGFDASANTTDETQNPEISVPKGMLFAVLYSGLLGTLLLTALIWAIPDFETAAKHGDRLVYWMLDSKLNFPFRVFAYTGIIFSQYFCGLTTLTSASRSVFSFASDGGFLYQNLFCYIHPKHHTPSTAIWACVIVSILMILYAPLFSIITVLCVVYLYLSYLIPVGLALASYGRSWTKMGPFNLGRWFPWAATFTLLGGIIIFIVGIQFPHSQAGWSLGISLTLMILCWCFLEKKRFKRPHLSTKFSS